MNNINYYIEIGQKNGLTFASSRKLSIFTDSCLFFAYTSLLKKKVGYSYGVIGAVGRRDQGKFIMNEESVGQTFNRTVEKRKLPRLLKGLSVDLDEYKKIITRVEKDINPFAFFKTVSIIYPKVLMQMGFCNSIMRYVSNNNKNAQGLGKSALVVAKYKDGIANLIYENIEPAIKRQAKKIGQQNNFDGDLLRYLTFREFKKYIQQKKLLKNQLKILVARRKAYFYIFYQKRSYIFTGEENLNKAWNKFSGQEVVGDIIRGVSVYPGKVKGRVYKTFHGVKTGKRGYVLVTNITRPSDTPYLKRFAAIITDEGGILSHVAVISRELKTPCIMSARLATKVLKNNDLVEVDANLGIIKKLS